jgi:hypothetical protein
MKTVIVPPPGMFFTYHHNPKLFRKNNFGLAQMLSIEPENGIVHLRIYVFKEAPHDHVGIAHMPILASSVEKSHREDYEQHKVPIDSWKYVNEWRDAYNKGLVGAFSPPIWKAVDMIWETVTANEDGNTLDNCLVESAYPVKGPKGTFNVIHAITSKRVQSGA